jgi:hypothetical protein
MKYLLVCLIGTSIVLNACSSSPIESEKALELEQKINPGCTYMKQEIALEKARLTTATATDKERISKELIQQDLKFASQCPITAQSATAD